MRTRTGSTDLHFLDTNILVYALFPGDPRRSVADRLIAKDAHVSVQILNEFVSVARRRFETPWEELAPMLEFIQALCGQTLALDLATHRRAVDIAQRYGFHIYDASIVASALLAGCETLYTEDLQDGQRVDGLVVRNPFRAGAS